MLNGKPLLSYVINNALHSKFITDIVVSSEDEEILEYASNFPVNLRIRTLKLASDEITLDPVVFDAYKFMETKTGKKFDIVITLQPTSPLLKPKTIDDAIQELILQNVDSIISVIDNTHLMWTKNGNKYIPLYKERKNRQWLSKIYKETGAFLISRAECINKSSRLGEKIIVYQISDDEGLDIDTIYDWLIAEALLNRLKLVFVVNGNIEIGMGHVYRTLSLADSFLGHEISFITFNSNKVAVDLIINNGYQVRVISENEIIEIIRKINPDIVINDILDTSADYINKLKNCGFFVVNFEDLGDGSREAHLVFNALYELSDPPINHRYGYKYECLNRCFLIQEPINFKEVAETILITFGGVDQNNLTLKVTEIIPELIKNTTIKKIKIVLGPSYQARDVLKEKINCFPPEVKSKINIICNTTNMALLMRDVDIGITSNGRTVYEMAAMGIPTLSISQNDRETLHLFSRYHKGIEYLGIAPTVTKEKIYEKIIELVTNKEKRKSMYEAQINSNVKQGIERVNYEILYEFKRWKYGRDKNREQKANKGHDE